MNQSIIDKIVKHYQEVRGARGFDKYIAENPEVKEELENILYSVPWFENIRNVYIAACHGIFNVVRCHNCRKNLKVENAIYGKNVYCCQSCAVNDPERKERQKNTCLDKYGTTTPLLNVDCKKKTIETCRMKFGKDMFAGSDEYKRRVPSPFRLKEVQEKNRKSLVEHHGEEYGKVLFNRRKEKVEKRNVEKYGVPYILMNEEKMNQTHDTMAQRYGSRFYWGSDNSKENHFDVGFARIANWNNLVTPMFTRDEYVGAKKVYKWKCMKCGNEFEQEIYVTGLGEDRLIPRCLECYPLSTTSIAEKEVLDFVRSIYSGDIIQNAKTFLDGKRELDIYIPDKRISIEFDGLYWHSEKYGKGEYYHLQKTEECEKKGIHLIHIFEDEWVEKQEIVKDRIRSILGISQERLFARKCLLKEVCPKECNKFLEENHLQGRDNSKHRYGLYFENELVAVMTFGKPRFNKNYDYELMRYCSKNGCNVVGGAGKLLSYFRKNHKGSIVSYADRRYSIGNLYEKLGFVKKHVSKPNYFWVYGMKKYSRYQCQKHKLVELLGEGFNPISSECENMMDNGYSRIFDCGNIVYAME